MSEARERRKRLDHERYMRHQEERKAKQRAYYAAHREQCIQSVRASRRKQITKALYALLHKEEIREEVSIVKKSVKK